MINASAALNCHLLARIYENFMRHTSFKHAVLKSMACPLVAVMLCLYPLHTAAVQTVPEQGSPYMGSIFVTGTPGLPGDNASNSGFEGVDCRGPSNGHPGTSPSNANLNQPVD